MSSASSISKASVIIIPPLSTTSPGTTTPTTSQTAATDADKTMGLGYQTPLVTSTADPSTEATATSVWETSYAPESSAVLYTPSSTSETPLITSATQTSSSSSRSTETSKSNSVSTKVVELTITTAAKTTSRPPISSVSPASTSSAAQSGSKSSVSTGAIAGIAVGFLVFLCIAGVFGTRWYRKRQRAARNANRASTWAPGSDDEKPVAGALPLASLPVASKFIDSPYSEPPKYSDLLGDVPLSLSSTPTLPPTPRLVDGEHVRVITAFNRTLEDELAIIPNQQLRLINKYDDGWALCENSRFERGVVPISCLAPW